MEFGFYFKCNGSHWKVLASLVAQMVKKKKKNLPAMQETQVQSLDHVRKIAWKSKWLLQYSCLEISMDRGVWWATVYWVAKRWT